MVLLIEFIITSEGTTYVDLKIFGILILLIFPPQLLFRLSVTTLNCQNFTNYRACLFEPRHLRDLSNFRTQTMTAYTKICSCASELTINPDEPDSISSKLWREFIQETAKTRGYRSFFYGYRKSSVNVLQWMIGKAHQFLVKFTFHWKFASSVSLARHHHIVL